MASLELKKRIVKRSMGVHNTAIKLCNDLIKLMPGNLNPVERFKVNKEVENKIKALRIIYKDDAIMTAFINSIDSMIVGLKNNSLNIVDREKTNIEISYKLMILLSMIEKEFNEKSDAYLSQAMGESDDCMLEEGYEDGYRRQRVANNNMGIQDKLTVFLKRYSHDFNPDARMWM